MMRTQSQPHPLQAGSKAAPAKSELLGIDPSTFRSKFDRTPFVITHSLTENALFRPERLMQLARSLPAENVEYNAGALPIGCDPSETPRNGLSVEETIQRIEDCKSWMVLKYVDQDPEYRDLILRCLDEIKVLSEPVRPGMRAAEAFIFLSSPGSITPYHMDPEHNFLLQIRGDKFITVFDRSLVSQEELENFYLGAHRNMNYRDDYLAKSVSFELRPGEGLHVPVTAPHYVRNGSSVSISFSITFRTLDLDNRALLHNANAYLRMKGLSPSAAGRRPSLDALKVFSARFVRRVRASAGQHTR